MARVGAVGGPVNGHPSRRPGPHEGDNGTTREPDDVRGSKGDGRVTG
jgi:hypothetical protein